MKRLGVFTRVASRHRPCYCRQRTRRLDQSSRAISTSRPRCQNDNGKPPKHNPNDDILLPDGSLNPKYHNPRYVNARSLPKGWREAVIGKAFDVDDDDIEASAGVEEGAEKKVEKSAAEDGTEEATEDEDGDFRANADIASVEAAVAEADAAVDGFNGPGGTDVWGLTPQEARRMANSRQMVEEKHEPGFFSESEENDNPGEDPEMEADDITSLAHSELEQHRELREFARVIAWDMPLLWNHRKEFEPPTAATPLRFRYTTYLGETHPASRKVVVDFQPSLIPDLQPVQLSKLIKLLAARYNPSTKTAKMSCEMFPTAAQNKRYLGDLIDKLLVEARDSTDTFEDVPFDFRHHKEKRKLQFPEEWKMTEERRAQLDKRRTEVALLEASEAKTGRLVDGNARIESVITHRTEMEPVMVPAMERPVEKSRAGRRQLR